MAETITIPSPTVFLRTSSEEEPSKEDESAEEQAKSPVPITRKRAATTKKRKKEAIADDVDADDDAEVEMDKTPEARVGMTMSKKSKSRNGCTTCKAKRLKCDETKPTCEQCRKRNVDCGGYKKDFKWRPFEEIVSKYGTQRRKKTHKALSPPNEDHDALTAIHSEPSEPEEGLVGDKSYAPNASKHVHVEDPSNAAIAKPLSPEPDEDSANTQSEPTVHLAEATGSLQDIQDHAHADLGVSPGQVLDLNHDFSMDLIDTPSAALENSDEHGHLIQTEVEETEWIPFRLGDIDFMQGFCSPFMPLSPSQLENSIDDIDEVSDVQTAPETMDDQCTSVVLLEPEPDSPNAAAVWMRKLYAVPNYSISDPPMTNITTEMVIRRFDRYTCGILSVKNGDNENPWRTLMWPMAQNSQALFHAISAMAAFHAAREDPAFRVAGQEHSVLCFRSLRKGIGESSMNVETAIGTTLTMAFAESWDHHTMSGNGHIKGARALINLALARHRAEPRSGIELARLKFLCNAWVYMDVVARMTSTDEDESDDYDQIFSLYSNPEVQNSGFGINFGMQLDAQLDPLMGCAGTLFPLIGRVANLVRRVRRSPTNSAPIITQAMELKLLVEGWEVPDFIEPPEDASCSVAHSVQTAEAFRWATLLYLHQAVPEIPGPTSAEMAEKVMVYLATVPLESRSITSHMFPMIAAGCEASNEEDRQWVRNRWTAMVQRLRIGPIDRCMDITSEVWRRRDEYEEKMRCRTTTSSLRSEGLPSAFRRNSNSSYSRPSNVFEDLSSDECRPQRENYRRQTLDAAARRPKWSSMPLPGVMDAEYTVRGRLHWLGVMRDWEWEVLLG